MARGHRKAQGSCYVTHRSRGRFTILSPHNSVTDNRPAPCTKCAQQRHNSAGECLVCNGLAWDAVLRAGAIGWVDIPPAKPGWFWFCESREDGMAAPVVVEVCYHRDVLCSAHPSKPVSKMAGYWWPQPLRPPKRAPIMRIESEELV